MSLERIRLADGEPMALMHNYLPAGVVQLDIELLELHGLYELLRASGIGLYSATQSMGAKNASALRGPRAGRDPRHRADHHGAHRLRPGGPAR